MVWKLARFQLLSGETFAIWHTLSDDVLGSDFDVWSQKKTDITQAGFIQYLNRDGIIKAMTPEKYKALTDQDDSFNDGSLMPFGKHKGKAMANVPAYYLILMYDRGWLSGRVKQYVIHNLDILTKEAAKVKK